jgi:hypothetical protein
MEQDVREFLGRFSADYLLELGVLQHYGSDVQLRARSVGPLRRLMSQQGVSRLVDTNGRWFLTEDGQFCNPRTLREIPEQGWVEELANPGSIFTDQNRSINPHFGRFRGR